MAGALIGNVIIADEALRRRFAEGHLAAGTGLNRFGVLTATAAYEGGAEWVDALCRYLAGNAALFTAGIAAISGVRPMPLGLISPGWTSPAPAWTRSSSPPASSATRASSSRGTAFGKGGESFLRFNLATRAPGWPRRWRGCGRLSPTCSSERLSRRPG